MRGECVCVQFSPASPLPPSEPHLSTSILLKTINTWKKTRTPPLTFTHALLLCRPPHPKYCQLPKVSSRRVFAILTACVLVGDPGPVNCLPPSLLGFLVELLLHLLPPHPVRNPEDAVKNIFATFHALFLGAPFHCF